MCSLKYLAAFSGLDGKRGYAAAFQQYAEIVNSFASSLYLLAPRYSFVFVNSEEKVEIL